MTIVEKVAMYLHADGPRTLHEIYEHLPEHTPASIRGNINRAIEQNKTNITRIEKGVYALIEIVKVEEDSETGKKTINYTATYVAENAIAASFHSGFETTAEDIRAGIYQHESNFDSFEEMCNSADSLRGMLVNADARDVLSRIKDKSFDCLVTDPPYKVISGGNKSKGSPRGMLAKNDGKIFRCNDIRFDEWLPEMYRILKPGAQAYVFTNLLNLRDLWDCAESCGFRIHNLLVWEKNTANPSRWYMKNAEYILYMYKPGNGQPVSIKDCGSKMVHQFNNIVGNKVHETEKPVNLLKMYIQNSCPLNGWVIDPFAGSNSTMTAALLSGMRCFACEMDEKYIGPAVERISGLLQTGTDPLAHYGAS